MRAQAGLWRGCFPAVRTGRMRSHPLSSCEPPHQPGCRRALNPILHVWHLLNDEQMNDRRPRQKEPINVHLHPPSSP